MTRLTIDVDAHELTALTRAVQEYRQHACARGEFIAQQNAEELDRKLERAVERILRPTIGPETGQNRAH